MIDVCTKNAGTPGVAHHLARSYCIWFGEPPTPGDDQRSLRPRDDVLDVPWLAIVLGALAWFVLAMSLALLW